MGEGGHNGDSPETISRRYRETENLSPGTAKTVPVAADNFIRAESDFYFSNIVNDGTLGKFTHNRTPTPIDEQTVIRMSRDTLYSAAVFDLNASPVTITLLNAGKRLCRCTS
jgi:hypothetical protein